MNKTLAGILLGSILYNGCVQAQDSTALATYPKTAAQYIFSTDGIKDIAAVYAITMLITLIHEMGHAAAAKVMCGVPVDIVIGGPRRKDSYLKCAGIEFAGFNPLNSDARWEERRPGDEELYKPSLAQDTAMLLAGPLAQAITGYCLHRCLKHQDNFYIAKTAAIGCIVDTVIGLNGVYGATCVPWSDAAKIVKNIKKYFST